MCKPDLMLIDALPRTPEDLEPLDLLRTPTWVIDLDRGVRWWVNTASLRMWNSPSREELLRRTTGSTPSDATRTRFATLRARFLRGESSLERWSFYPDGAAPIVADCHVSGLLIADQRGEPGRIGMLVEARALGELEINPTERRAAEALRFLGELVSYYGLSGQMLMRNPAALHAFGEPPRSEEGDHFFTSFIEPGEAALARARLEAGEVYRAEVAVRTLHGDRWYDTEARRSHDPVTGQLGTLVTQRDIGERREAEAALAESRYALATQAEELRRLAAPVISVADGVLALPLIGTIDIERVQVALDAVLPRVAAERIRRVIIDLTGAAVLDEGAADGLRSLARVLQLQGVDPALTGIRPELARALARSGLDLTNVAFFRSIAQALRARSFAPRS